MLQVERQRKILELLEERPALTVNELHEMMGVSRETIRLDLRLLEKEGLIIRSHGGAVRMDGQEADRGFTQREREYPEQKRAIARAALAYIKPGDLIMMDASTTVLALARLLPRNFRLTVVTNSIAVPVVLAERDDLTVIATGGILRPRSRCYYGPHAEEIFATLHAHKAFVSCQGIDAIHGVTESNPLDSQVKLRMVEATSELIVLADRRKLGNVSLMSFAPLGKVSRLITDEGVNPGQVEALREAGLVVELAGLNNMAEIGVLRAKAGEGGNQVG